MLPRRLTAGRPLLRQATRISLGRPSPQQLRCASEIAGPDLEDPDMNGGYINPPPQKRALRDPNAGWWDPQERRNFGEPIHEDNDILGVFTTHPYTHAAPGKAAFHLGCFVLAFLGVCGVVYQLYPDKPSAPKEYEDGLDKELGGRQAVIAHEKGAGDVGGADP